jgi:hypothetical protein
VRGTSSIRSRKSVTARVDRQRTNINCFIVMVDLDQLSPLPSLRVDTAGAVDKINSCEGVTIGTDR